MTANIIAQSCECIYEVVQEGKLLLFIASFFHVDGEPENEAIAMWDRCMHAHIVEKRYKLVISYNIKS